MPSMKTLRKISTLLCAVILLSLTTLSTAATPNGAQLPAAASAIQDYPFAAPDESLALECQSAVLMDAASGAILYMQNAEQALPPASVTKIMTLLLVEEIERGTLQWNDPISVSETAAGMGGSQIFLEVGEVMSCEDMIKSVVISSANDAAVALAEHVAGSLEAFVQRMNERANALGMQNTHFENATGLDDTAQNHMCSAMDIAIMSRALISHSKILEYSSIWMDTIRNGTFGLTNTNRLVRFYRGATGLKTGSTSKAGFCVSATACRDDLSLICVIMGAETRDIRNAQAAKLLDWGFANYARYTAPAKEVSPIRVCGGEMDTCKLQSEAFSCVVPKNRLSEISVNVEMPSSTSAPIKAKQNVGKQIYSLGEHTLGESPIVALENVDRISFLTLWRRMLATILLR